MIPCEFSPKPLFTITSVYVFVEPTFKSTFHRDSAIVLMYYNQNVQFSCIQKKDSKVFDELENEAHV